MSRIDKYEAFAATLATAQVERFEESGRPNGFLQIPWERKIRVIIEELRKLSTTYICPMSTH